MRIILILVWKEETLMKTQDVLLDIIKDSDEHLSAEKIYFIAKSIHPSISVGTIYRNLTSMTEKGIIGHVAIPSGSARFDKNAYSHPHGHCPRCGEVFDIYAPAIDDAIDEALGSSGNSYQLTVNCLCERCRATEK